MSFNDNPDANPNPSYPTNLIITIGQYYTY